MNFIHKMVKYGNVPITHSVMLSLLKEYKRPNDKIHQLLRDGNLISLKKGLYAVSAELTEKKLESLIIANHLMGPSYVSALYALNYHGIIPERVYEITSMTVKNTRKFENTLGIFSFKKLPLPYFSFGIKQLQIKDNQFVLVASPEKALCDHIVSSKRLYFRSIKETIEYLTTDLRADTTLLKSFDLHLMETWLPNAPKNSSLKFLIQALKVL